MADQGIWWKLWCSALDDPDLDNLDLADFGRYCKMGAFIKRQGQTGSIVLAPPARALCATFQVPDFNALIAAISRLPNVIVTAVSSETNATVTIKNWLKYQGDYSTERVRKFRARETPKKRREEMRVEEIKTGTALSRAATVVPHADNGSDPARSLLDFLNKKTGRNYRPVATTLGLIRSRLRSGATPDQMRAVIAVKCREWRDGELAIYLRPSTLFRASNFESYLGQLPATAFTREDNPHA